MRHSVATALIALALTASQAPAHGGAAELEKAIETIRRVEAGSKGSRQAAEAWRVVAKADVVQLPEILAGMDGANSLARNWLRSAIDEILDRAAREQKSVPLEALESFV